MPRVCVFDVNETLLDLGALDVHFQRVFGDAAARREWFLQMIQSSLVSTVTGVYANFSSVAMAALEMTAARRSVELSDDDRKQITGAMRSLPPHPDVADSLRRLRDAGVRLAALTNSVQDVADAQMRHAGLYDLFEQVLSADTAKRLKPAPEPYRMAAQRLGVRIEEVRLVAAHAWDVAGALRAGCAAAFVARPGQVLDPLVEHPDVVGDDLYDVAGRIIQIEVGAAG